MTITLPLQPQEEAKLIAVAQAKGLSTDALVREALDKILAEAPDVSPRKSQADRCGDFWRNTARLLRRRRLTQIAPRCSQTFQAPISDDCRYS